MSESEKEFSDFSGFEDFSGLDSTDEEKEDIQLTKVKEIAAKKTKNVKHSDQSGVVYIGRIPHGFYEQQLRQYLEQFGKIKNLRISRNKKTGASKHFGFVEFESRSVAEIVCEVMNNYLLFGHLLKVNMMDDSQIHKELFKGANKQFHTIPWGVVGKQRSMRKHSREFWEEKQKEFEKQKKRKKEELAELGIVY